VRCVVGACVFQPVQPKVYLQEVVELRNGVTLDLSLNTTLEDAIKERADVRFFSKVQEAL
jgi:hypothetical protein